MIGHEEAIYDLGKARAEIGRRSWGKKLQGLIGSYIDAYSSLIDLRSATVAVDAAIKLNDGDEGEDRLQDSGTALALRSHIMSAIILYMRATETSSKVRRQLPAASWLDKENQTAHVRIKALRNGCIGHFGYGHEAGYQTWVRETAILEMGERGANLTFTWSRANMLKADAELLSNLLSIVTPRCRSLVDERGAAVMKEMDEVGPFEMMPVLERHIFDPESIFPGSNAAQWFARYRSTPDGHFNRRTPSPKS